MDPALDEAPALSAEDWSRYLTDALQNPIRVTYGRARHRVVQSKGYWDDPSGAPVEVRLSGFFAGAPAEVREALAVWLKCSRRPSKRKAAASAVLDRFIAEGLRRQPAPKRKKRAEEAAGETLDLAPLLEGLVTGPLAEFRRRDFEPRGLPTIAWGRRGKSQARRSLQLGSYHDDLHHVRVHRVLDQPEVPRFFVRFVVFHELLHAARAAEAVRNPLFARGRLHHDKHFRERERAYGDFDRANAWQQRHVGALIRSARSGRAVKLAR